MYKKLLVACDGSEGSQIAVVHAAILAKKLDAQLSALWVRGYLPHYPESVGEIAEEEEAALEFFEEIKAQLSSIAVAQGVIIQANLRSGHPAQQIVALAQESSADLIVLGNRGHSRLWGELLGHTADRVNEHAPCSVLIVRSKKEEARYRKMLIGFDGSSASERALRTGLALAKHIGSEVDVLWIDEAPVARATPSEAHDDELRARDFFITLRKTIDSAAAEQGLEVNAGLRRGNAPRILVGEAESGGFRLIVVGHRGHSGLWGRLLGGAADRVSHHAQCDVLIVR
jgi:nucleotide-binding universal stress UspA family protein